LSYKYDNPNYIKHRPCIILFDISLNILALFHQSIAESGSALASWAFDSTPEQHAKVFKRFFKCSLFSIRAPYSENLIVKRNWGISLSTFRTILKIGRVII
jgi:hypothetical protein